MIQVTLWSPSASEAVPPIERKDDVTVVAGADVGDVIVTVGSVPTVFVKWRLSMSKNVVVMDPPIATWYGSTSRIWDWASKFRVSRSPGLASMETRPELAVDHAVSLPVPRST